MKNNNLDQRIKSLRLKKGYSQEEFAEAAGVALRTVQRLENGENVPRGDTLKKMAIALEVSPDDLIDWQVQVDPIVLIILNISQLALLAFPLLGIILPLVIWIIKRSKISLVDHMGKRILNFQITWCMFLFLIYIFLKINMIANLVAIPYPWQTLVLLIGSLYLYNITLIILNTFRCVKKRKVWYKPAIRFF